MAVASAKPYENNPNLHLAPETTTPTPHYSIFMGQMLFLTPNQQYWSTECNLESMLLSLYCRASSRGRLPTVQQWTSCVWRPLPPVLPPCAWTTCPPPRTCSHASLSIHNSLYHSLVIIIVSCHAMLHCRLHPRHPFHNGDMMQPTQFGRGISLRMTPQWCHSLQQYPQASLWPTMCKYDVTHKTGST